ncbi:MAG TPA: COR domain-containing protein [Gemmataceae bacterium]|nr:COR domain-containing protein [Gemmataceae bacterium]
MRHPTLQVLCLWNNRIRGCDPAILEEFNCLPAARSHFADREFDPREDRELKLILLGNGRVGKTSLRKRLIHDTFDGKELSTHGIQLEEWDIELASGAARLNVWDFGGQDIYHGTHALFLKSRAIFVIVWDRITEKTPSYTEGELTFENYPLQYWLDYVRTVSPGAPILVVENKCDGGAGSQPSADLGELANVHFSARSEAPTEREKLLVHIKTICEAELEDRDAWRIGGGRLAVKEKLLARRRAGEKLLSRYEFEQFCAAEGERISSSEELLKYLHNTGVVYHDATLFHDQIILDQRWAVDAIYTIYHRSRCVNQLRKAQGRFRRGDLHDLAWEDGRFPESVQQLFLGFMQSCSICFRIGEHHDDPEYVAPEFLPERAAVERDIDLRLRTVKTAEAMHFRYHHRFLHPGLMRRFLVRVGALYGDDALYWRNGVILDARKDQAVAEVVCRPRKDGHPSAGEIEIRTLGPGRMRLLARLRNELEKLHDAGTQVQQFASVDGKEWIDVAKLVDFRDLGACLSLTRTKVDLAPFLDLLHRDPDDLLEAQIPDAVPLPEEPARRVYVSYAWGDATPAGKLREAAMQEQCAILRGKAYEVVIDKEATRPGDLISKFIEEIGQGDRVLIVLSDKYLRSVHCMQELHWVYLTSLRKKEVFLKRIYPVVLEDAKIDTWEDRANWAEHWEKEYQKMEAKLRHLGAEGQRLYQSLKSWYADVGDMLAFIADKIRRQGLDGIDADF